MARCYLINAAVEFDPERHLLTDIRRPWMTVSLNIPSARCLQLLLERRYGLVGQSEFYPYVWGDDAAAVSVNTLYQNIALIRKALRLFDEDGHQFIITVPKKGFSLSTLFSVEETESSQVPASPVIMPEPTESPDVDNGVFEAEDEPVTMTSTRDVQDKHNITGIIFMLSAALLILLLLVQLTFTYRSPFRKEPLTFAYKQNIAGCTLFNNSQDSAPAKITPYLRNGAVDCQSTPYIYLTRSVDLTRISFLACRADINSESAPGCVTYYFLGRTQS